MNTHNRDALTPIIFILSSGLPRSQPWIAPRQTPTDMMLSHDDA